MDTALKQRITEIDYLKCVFILLMVAFHLSYISDAYPYAKKIVYTFHMPAFLFFSGYLNNIQKSTRAFARDMLFIFIPYITIETAYVIMSSVLPVREVVTDISLSALLHKIFIAPIGPYWYLQTLMLCCILYYTVYRLGRKLKPVSRFILFGLCLFALSYGLKIITFNNAIYFMGGVLLSQCGADFKAVFRPSLLALVPLTLLCCFPENLNRGSLGGVAITYLVISVLLFLYEYLPETVRKFTQFIGRNTLVILIFSPIFTLASKFFLPFFAFDPSGMCFLLVAVSLAVAGCLAITWAMDKLNLSRFYFGRKKMIQ